MNEDYKPLMIYMADCVEAARFTDASEMEFKLADGTKKTMCQIMTILDLDFLKREGWGPPCQNLKI